MKQRCRFCGCTQEDGCPVGCSWAAEDVCSICADFVQELDAYVDACRRVTKASLARMLREIDDAFLDTRVSITEAGRKMVESPKANRAKVAK